MDYKLSRDQYTVLEFIAEGASLRLRKDGYMLVYPRYVAAPPCRNDEIEQLIQLGLILHGSLTDSGRQVLANKK
jgi:hypothetical protein